MLVVEKFDEPSKRFFHPQSCFFCRPRANEKRESVRVRFSFYFFLVSATSRTTTMRNEKVEHVETRLPQISDSFIVSTLISNKQILKKKIFLSRKQTFLKIFLMYIYNAHCTIKLLSKTFFSISGILRDICENVDTLS